MDECCNDGRGRLGAGAPPEQARASIRRDITNVPQGVDTVHRRDRPKIRKRRRASPTTPSTERAIRWGMERRRVAQEARNTGTGGIKQRFRRLRSIQRRRTAETREKKERKRVVPGEEKRGREIGPEGGLAVRTGTGERVRVGAVSPGLLHGRGVRTRGSGSCVCSCSVPACVQGVLAGRRARGHGRRGGEGAGGKERRRRVARVATGTRSGGIKIYRPVRGGSKRLA